MRILRNDVGPRRIARRRRRRRWRTTRTAHVGRRTGIPRDRATLSVRIDITPPVRRAVGLADPFAAGLPQATQTPRLHHQNARWAHGPRPLTHGNQKWRATRYLAEAERGCHREVTHAAPPPGRIWPSGRSHRAEDIIETELPGAGAAPPGESIESPRGPRLRASSSRRPFPSKMMRPGRELPSDRSESGRGNL